MLSEKQEEILEAVWTTNERDVYDAGAIRHRCPVPISDDDLNVLMQLGLLSLGQEGIRLTAEGKRLTEPIKRRHRLAELAKPHGCHFPDTFPIRVACVSDDSFHGGRVST